MSADLRPALVFGGSGTLGAAVVRGLRAAGLPVAFTYRQNQSRADVLASETGARAARLDLTDLEATRRFVAELEPRPRVFVHCAGVAATEPLAEITPARWSEAQRVHCESVLVAAQALASRGDGPAEWILIGGMDPSQSLPVPITYAATQGMLAAMTMALAKELGPREVRVNMVAVGLLEGGLSTELRPELVRDYEEFSAMRRRGRPEEIVPTIRWLALENTYLNGRVLKLNGGI